MEKVVAVPRGTVSDQSKAHMAVGCRHRGGGKKVLNSCCYPKIRIKAGEKHAESYV